MRRAIQLQEQINSHREARRERASSRVALLRPSVCAFFSINAHGEERQILIYSSESHTDVMYLYLKTSVLTCSCLLLLPSCVYLFV